MTLSQDQSSEVESIDLKLTEIKEKGNIHFKSKDYVQAISSFSKGVDIASKAPDYALNHEGFKLRLTQLFTNRCLCHHHLGNQDAVIADASYVLTHLDP